MTPPTKRTGRPRGGGGGGGRGGRSGDNGGGRRGRGGGGDHRRQHEDNRKPNTNLANVRLCQSGEGTTAAQKAVKRIPADILLQMRLDFLQAPIDWDPPEAVLWTSETRKDEIVAKHKAPRKAGEVTARPPKRPPVKDTAPALEDCKPLEVNEETRWKAKVMDATLAEELEDDSDEMVLKKALLILNKLSLTKFAKLSQELVDLGIARNEVCLQGYH